MSVFGIKVINLTIGTNGSVLNATKPIVPLAEIVIAGSRHLALE